MQSKVNTSQSLKSVLMKLRQRMRFHIGHFLDIYIGSRIREIYRHTSSPSIDPSVYHRDKIYLLDIIYHVLDIKWH